MTTRIPQISYSGQQEGQAGDAGGSLAASLLRLGVSGPLGLLARKSGRNKKKQNTEKHDKCYVFFIFNEQKQKNMENATFYVFLEMG